MSQKTDRLGADGEDAAAAHLERCGFRILSRRARTRFGEIDILAEDGVTLVVVEVRTRSSSAFGDPAESIDRRKADRLRRTALGLMADRPDLRNRPLRVDLVEVLWPSGARPEIRHLTDVVSLE